MLVADPAAEDPVAVLKAQVASDPSFWVGVRFNPYKWQNEDMANEVGQQLFAAAGELNLPVGFMPFKGLARHIVAIETLLKASPATQVIIDHWGFFLQPATGVGEDREVVEASWESLLRLGETYPQVHVKLSAMFRNARDAPGFTSLEDRFEQLLSAFSSKRVLWGSDAPYFLDHGEYAGALALTSWASWQRLPESEREDILHGNAERLFGGWGNRHDEA